MSGNCAQCAHYNQTLGVVCWAPNGENMGFYIKKIVNILRRINKHVRRVPAAQIDDFNFTKFFLSELNSDEAMLEKCCCRTYGRNDGSDLVASLTYCDTSYNRHVPVGTINWLRDHFVCWDFGHDTGRVSWMFPVAVVVVFVIKIVL